MWVYRILLLCAAVLRVQAGAYAAAAGTEAAVRPAGGLDDRAGVFPLLEAEALRVEMEQFRERTGMLVALATYREADGSEAPDSAACHAGWIEPFGSGVAVTFEAESGRIGFSASQDSGFPTPAEIGEIFRIAGGQKVAGDPAATLSAFMRAIMSGLADWKPPAVEAAAAPAPAPADAGEGLLTRLLRYGLIAFCAGAALLYCFQTVQERFAGARAARPTVMLRIASPPDADRPHTAGSPKPAARRPGRRAGGSDKQGGGRISTTAAEEESAPNPPASGNEPIASTVDAPAEPEPPPAPPPAALEPPADGLAAQPAPAPPPPDSPPAAATPRPAPVYFPVVRVGRRLGAGRGGGVVAEVPFPDVPAAETDEPDATPDAPSSEAEATAA